MTLSPDLLVRKPVVLLTGFGPFPGVAENVSARLVATLAPLAQTEFPAFDFHTSILPTEWMIAPSRLTTLLSELRPVLALHFGVARDARGFVVETEGRNACRTVEDAAGILPLSPVLVAGGAGAYAATLPTAAIVRRLEALGLPVSVSDDAGGYLCNAILYHGLRAAAEEHQPRRSGFIHIPHDLSGPPLSFDAAVEGGLEIIRAGLNAAVNTSLTY